MPMRLPFAVLALCCLLAGEGRAAADDAPKPDLKPLLAEVRTLVGKHYPKATVTLRDQTLHFECNTRKFLIHEPLRTGEWQDAHEQTGPQKGGIYGDIALRAGRYEGAAVVPQSFDKRYFTLLVMAPYSRKRDHHLYVHLKYPRDVPEAFLPEFERLMTGFEKHIAVGTFRRPGQTIHRGGRT